MGDAEETGYRVTADELFAQVGEVVELVRNMDEMGDASDALFALHRTLVLTCHEGIRGTAQAYGNLFAQVDYLCLHRFCFPGASAVIAGSSHGIQKRSP